MPIHRTPIEISSRSRAHWPMGSGGEVMLTLYGLLFCLCGLAVWLYESVWPCVSSVSSAQSPPVAVVSSQSSLTRQHPRKRGAGEELSTLRFEQRERRKGGMVSLSIILPSIKSQPLSGTTSESERQKSLIVNLKIHNVPLKIQSHH